MTAYLRASETSAGSFRSAFRRKAGGGVLTPDILWQNFLYALRDFSFSDSLLRDDHENAPHILAAERVKSTHFRSNLSGYSGQVLQCVFEDADQTRVGISFAAASGSSGASVREVGFWDDMRDIVARKLSAFDAERTEAFHVLIDTCRAWQIVAREGGVGRARVRGASIAAWRETLGGLVIRLPRAMEVLWRAYPCADPLVEEGVQICFDDTPGLCESLNGGRSLRRGRHSDAEIDETMAAATQDLRVAGQEVGRAGALTARTGDEFAQYHREHADAVRELVRALRRAAALRTIAEQYLKNLEALRPVAGRIAYRTATVFQRRPRHMQDIWADPPFDDIAGDERRAEILHAHCRDVRAGVWFDGRRTAVIQNLNLLNREAFLVSQKHGDVVYAGPDGHIFPIGGEGFPGSRDDDAFFS